MRIFVGADHNGFKLKEALKAALADAGHEVIDVGADSLVADDDYPKYAFLLATRVLGENDAGNAHGILICASGQGMSIAANRVRGIRAGLAWNKATAVSAKEDDDVNVLVLPSKYLETNDAIEAIRSWLGAEFKSDPKYKRRLDELEEIYG